MWQQDLGRVHAPKGESRGKLSPDFIGNPLERILTPFCKVAGNGHTRPQWSPFWELWVYFSSVSSPLQSNSWERSPEAAQSGKAFSRLTWKKKKKIWRTGEHLASGGNGGALEENWAVGTNNLLLDFTLENYANQNSDLIQKVPLPDPWSLFKDPHTLIPN